MSVKLRNPTIGSGDINKVLSAPTTKGYRELWNKFLSLEAPYYNALASPINATRAGAILEGRFLLWLSEGYIPQVRATCKAQDVLTVSLDFAKRDKGEIVDFIELKTIFITDFITIIKPLGELNEKEAQAAIKKQFSTNYKQVQSQLYATDLPSATLAFLSTKSYDDEENLSREIDDNDVVYFRITRDKKMIETIAKRLDPFQFIKDHFKS